MSEEGTGDSAAALLGVLRRRDEANALSRGLVGLEYLLFPATSLDTPPLQPAELGFLRVVAWLYVHYYEVGVVGVKFLAGLFMTYEIPEPDRLWRHMHHVGRLRTYLQHNLDPHKATDRETQNEAEEWFRGACGSRIPAMDAQWTYCLAVLLTGAEQFLHGCVKTLRGIEADESRDEIVTQWVFRVRRHHPPAAFDPIVAQVSTDIGRSHLDVVRFRRRFYDRWVDALNVLDGEYDFPLEARRLIETTLVLDATPVLPITGRDVMAEFGIAPGPAVGAALEHAMAVFREAPCDRDTLMEKIRPLVTELPA